MIASSAANSVSSLSAEQTLRVQSGDVTLAVRLWERAGAATLVLVHGYPDNQHVWDRVVENLTARYRVVTYDVRGAGGSDTPKRIRDYQLNRLAQDLCAITDAVCADQPFHLVAHDWGSIHSWESVTEPSMHSRIASFTSISGPCFDHVGFWIRKRLLRPTPRHLGQLCGQLISSWYIYLFHVPWLMPWLWKLVFARRWPAILKSLEGLGAYASTTRRKDGYYPIQLYRANFFPRLMFPRRRYTQVPVQLIVAQQDRHVRPQLFEDLAAWAPRLRRREVDAGHWGILLDEPHRLAQYVSEFVTHLETQRPGMGAMR